MVMKELVETVNKELRAIKSEAVTGREHPLIIRIVEQLILLTTIHDGSTDDVQTDIEAAILPASSLVENQGEIEPVKTFDPPMPGGNFAAQMERQAAREKATAEWDDTPPTL